MLAIDGEKSVCSDEAVKETIAGFPPEINDHDLLSKIKGENAIYESSRVMGSGGRLRGLRQQVSAVSSPSVHVIVFADCSQILCKLAT